MPITLQWDQTDPSILICQFAGRWSWDEFRTMSYESFELIKQRFPQRVDGIADISRGQFVPANALYSVQEMIKIASLADNSGIVVITGANKLTQLLFLCFRNLYPVQARKLAMAQSLEAAHQMIYKDRQDNTSTV